jgi:hypothetical protein
MELEAVMPPTLAVIVVAVASRPVPVTATDCVAPETFKALSVMVTVSLRDPLVVGAKAMAKAHEPPAATAEEAAQVVPAALVKSVGKATALGVSVAFPMLLTVTV